MDRVGDRLLSITRQHPVAAVIVLTLAMHLPWIFGSPLAATEPHRALPAHQMAEGGRAVSWQVVTLFGQVYHRKPPMHIWQLAAAESVLGASEWVWRLPSVLWTAAAGAFVVWFARRHGSGEAGAWAVVLFAMLMPLWNPARQADIDASNNAAGVIFALIGLHLGLSSTRSWWPWVIALALAAVTASLIKGPAYLPLAGGTAIALLLTRQRLAATIAISAIGLGLFVLWAWWTSAQREIATLNLSGGTSGASEAAANLLPESAQDVIEALLLPVMLLALAVPTTLALVTLHRVDFTRRARPINLVLLATISAIVIAILFSMAQPRYTYMLLPMLAVAGAMALARGRLLIGTRFATVAAFCLPLATFALGLRELGGAVDLIVTVAATLLAVVIARKLIHHLALPTKTARPAIYAAILLLLPSLTSGLSHQRERQAKSALGGSLQLAAAAAHRPVITGRLLFAHPELFHYGELNVDYRGEARLRANRIRPGELVAIFEDDRDRFDDHDFDLLLEARVRTEEQRKFLLLQRKRADEPPAKR